MLFSPTVVSWFENFFQPDRAEKLQPFDEILASRIGETHYTGTIATAGKHSWERGKILSIESFCYDSYEKRPISITVSVETSDGIKEMYLGSTELHYLAPYVPARSVDELVSCVIPVRYSEQRQSDFELSIGSSEDSKQSCQMAAENGYLITQESDFSKHPSEVIASST